MNRRKLEHFAALRARLERVSIASRLSWRLRGHPRATGRPVTLPSQGPTDQLTQVLDPVEKTGVEAAVARQR